jgi:hypothetical protein
LILPRRVISKCPAIILAVNRTLREIGRIKFLRVSTKIMKGAMDVGVLNGNRCVNIMLVFLFHLNVIKEIHTGSPRDREIERWLVAVNT